MREINKKPFSVGLYIEGLRQLRIVGILGAILLFCSSAIITISNALSTQRQMELYQDSLHCPCQFECIGSRSTVTAAILCICTRDDPVAIPLYEQTQ